MSRTTKIALVGLALAGVGLIIWRRHMASVTDVGTYTPSHNLTAASSGANGSVSSPPPANKFGSNAKDDALILQNSVNQGHISADQALQIYDYTESARGSHPGPPPSIPSVPPSTGPATETRSGRGHF